MEVSSQLRVPANLPYEKEPPVTTEWFSGYWVLFSVKVTHKVIHCALVSTSHLRNAYGGTDL